MTQFAVERHEEYRRYQGAVPALIPKFGSSSIVSQP